MAENRTFSALAATRVGGLFPAGDAGRVELAGSSATPQYAMDASYVDLRADFTSNYWRAAQAQPSKIDVPVEVVFDAPEAVEQASISHVDSARTLLDRHLHLFNLARERLNDATERDGVAARFLAFVEKWQDDPDVQALLQGFVEAVPGAGTGAATGGAGATGTLRLRPRPLLRVSGNRLVSDEGAGTGTGTGTGDEPEDNDTSLLFKVSRFAMDDFHVVDARRNALERLRRRKQRQRGESLRRSAGLEREIAVARREYAGLDGARREAEEDYALVRGLLEEQLQAVDDAFVERHRRLSAPVALCFARVQDLPVRTGRRGTALVPRVAAGRLPAACDGAGQPPARLLPFLDLLADQPMSAWRALADDWHRLPPEWILAPPRPTLPAYVEAIPALPVAFRGLARAVPVPMVQRAGPWSRAEAPTSQAARGRRAADGITLEQLTRVRTSALRNAARRLQDDLSRALACLVHQLAALPAPDRFTWSRLAEDDQLPVDRPGAWPGFEAHGRGTTGLNLRMVVDWLHAQLADAAPPEARTALRTTLRACLLHAVDDDPAELLQGEVTQAPGAWRPGALFGATLNRVPTLKAPLRVYDAGRRLIGEARVVDSQVPEVSAAPASAVRAQIEVVTVYGAMPASFAGWTVAG